ncbi:MAG: hypothetical protein ABWW65_07855 [Thermoprotei archaeon]
MIGMNLSKLFGIVLLALLVTSIITAVPVVVFSEEDGEENEAEVEVEIELETGDNETEKPVLVINETLTFEEILDLAYTVRNISMPILNWSLEHNITLARNIIRLGDKFLERALNISETNATRAKAYAMVAAIIYGHAPVTAYPVLARTIREHVGVNHTIKDETVWAVYNKTVELKQVLQDAIDTALSLNITVPPQVDVLIAIGDGLLNTSKALLDKEYINKAFGFAVRAYHTYVRAYGVLIKSVFIEKLRLGARPEEPLTHRLCMRKLDEKVIGKILEKLPRHVREKVWEKIKRREIKTWKELEKAIREEVKKFRERLMEESVRVVADVLTALVLHVAYRLPPGNETHDAVWTWLVDHGFTKGFGHARVIDIRELRDYMLEFVRSVSTQYNVMGIELLLKAAEELESEIEAEVGTDIHLASILETHVLVHVSTHIGE